LRHPSVSWHPFGKQCLWRGWEARESVLGHSGSKSFSLKAKEGYRNTILLNEVIKS